MLFSVFLAPINQCNIRNPFHQCKKGVGCVEFTHSTVIIIVVSIVEDTHIHTGINLRIQLVLFIDFTIVVSVAFFIVAII